MKKTAIVTGSSRGIGFAIARQLGLDGYNIVMVATGPQEKNQAAVDALQKQGVCCAYVQANIGDHDDRLRILDAALTAFGRVDALVNNAGVAPRVRADLLEVGGELDYVLGVNTKGNMFLTQAVAKQMIRQGAAGWPEGRYCERLQLQFGGILRQSRRVLCIKGRRLHADDPVRRPPGTGGHSGTRSAPGRHRHRYDERRAGQI